MPHDNPCHSKVTGFSPTGILTPKEAASFLRVTESTLANWRCAGNGPRAMRVGARAVRYRFVDLEAFIAASTEGM